MRTLGTSEQLWGLQCGRRVYVGPEGATYADRLAFTEVFGPEQAVTNTFVHMVTWDEWWEKYKADNPAPYPHLENVLSPRLQLELD